MTKPKCIDCKYFCWWDGDYCCLPEDGDMRLIAESKHGEIDAESAEAIRIAADGCENFKEPINKLAANIYNIAWENFIKNNGTDR